MGNVIMVPVRLDALCLNTDFLVAAPRADFSLLPYWDGEKEVNQDVANISEAILSHPLEEGEMRLASGVHLHWALPDAMAVGSVDANSATFPPVPDRWLVTRRAENGQVERQWIVESDYLHPPDAVEVSDSATIPFRSKEDPRPFRYLGRVIPFDGWTESAASTADYLTRRGYQLTAVGYQCGEASVSSDRRQGYGDPAFAAFYPNCRSVFGMHDPDPPRRGIRYDVLGWYSYAANDGWIAKTRQSVSNGIEDIRKALQQAHHWDIVGHDSGIDFGAAARTLCFGRLAIQAAIPPACVQADMPVTVAVGNTVAQAFSAYLGQTIEGVEETSLDALQLSERLANSRLDVGAKFDEARHESGFMAIQGGTLWSLRQQASSGADPGDPETDGDSPTLPESLAHLLNELNQAQSELDRAECELDSLRTTLFADWYKYILASYPPDDSRDHYPETDRIRHFIEKNDRVSIARQRLRIGALTQRRDRLREAFGDAIDLFNKDVKIPYVLQPLAAPRYWCPRELVLLILDEGVPPTARHGQHRRPPQSSDTVVKNFLKCQLRSAPDSGIRQWAEVLGPHIDEYFSQARRDADGLHIWDRQPWHPFVLEWQVSVSPIPRVDRAAPGETSYASDFITRNYEFDTAGTDLVPKPGADNIGVQSIRNDFSGSSLLSPHAKTQLRLQFQRLKDNLKLSESDPLTEAMKKVENWLDNHRHLHAIGQSLSGFNQALLMSKQTLQLPIAEPLGFDDAQAFTASVRDDVGPANRSAPQPLTGFHPIRNGIMRIRRLRLVDTFGQTRNLTLKDNKLIATETMSVASHPHQVLLPPRLVQPVRLNFRWLAANGWSTASGDEPETNSHPASTPVCGWVLPNSLDQRLMIYDNAGKPLGSIYDSEDKSAPRKWTAAPGTATLPHQVENGYLRALTLALLRPGGQSIGDFIDRIETALENIDPDNYRQHASLAFLVGRPMAVVRASLNLELQGLPAISQDWHVFRMDMDRDLDSERGEATAPGQTARRYTAGVENVEFPFYIGDHARFNDGLVGFWDETPTDDGGNRYGTERFRVSATKAGCNLTLGSQPRKFMMLVDPRGAVHVSSGILPTKSLTIPHDQYAGALRTLAVTFQSGPILAPAGGKIAVPLPALPGHVWSWLEKDKGTWSEFGNLVPPDLKATFTSAQTLREGWLKLTNLQEDT